jgi:serine/threonine protein kinase
MSSSIVSVKVSVLLVLVKICDFGLVRSLTHEEHQSLILSEEVATRWYRSPEMLLGSNKYGKKTDVWSIGCIVAELLMGRPIFPG